MHVTAIEIATKAMIADMDVPDFQSAFEQYPQPEFTPGEPINPAELKRVIDAHSWVIYLLMWQGRNADLPPDFVWKPGVRGKLAPSYWPELEEDPWNNTYRFYIGPWPDNVPMHFRTYIGADTDNDGTPEPQKFPENEPIPNTQQTGDGAYGAPAPRDLDVYIWSLGANGADDQGYITDPNDTTEYPGGGDDINNWDYRKGWTAFY